MPNSQSITRLTNDQRARMARLLTEADIPVNNDDSIPLGDIIPVSRRNINANLVNNLINNDNLRHNDNLRQNPPVNNNLANIPEDDEDLYSGGRRRNKKTRKSRKKRKNKSNKSKKSKKRRTRKY
jgi:hypothetical protein